MVSHGTERLPSHSARGSKIHSPGGHPSWGASTHAVAEGSSEPTQEQCAEHGLPQTGPGSVHYPQSVPLALCHNARVSVHGELQGILSVAPLHPQCLSGSVLATGRAIATSPVRLCQIKLKCTLKLNIKIQSLLARA